MESITKIAQFISVKDLMSHDVFNVIIDTLTFMNISYQKHYFSSAFGKGCNIIVEYDNNSDEDILITAHYDGKGIVDNSGGVLLMLNLLQVFDPTGYYNYKFVFTDKEESFQQGIKYLLKDYYNNAVDKIKYHLNIDGIGVGESLVLYPSESYYLNNWANNDTTILLTDCSPLAKVNLPTFHMFSCFLEDAEIVIKNQVLSNNLSKYINNDWCVLNYQKSNILLLTEKALLILSEIEIVFSKEIFELY